MADFVRVPEADWRGILDTTREKIGTTEKMVSGEVAAAIAGIAAGGGGEDLPNGIFAFAMGETTYSDRKTSITVEHGLGAKPDAIFVYVPGFAFPSATVNIIGFFWVGYPRGLQAGATEESSAVAMVSSVNYTGFAPNGLAVSVTDTNFVAGRPSSVYYYQPGTTYRWCAIKFVEG